MNLVMTESGKFVEIQGTGEEATFDGEQLNEMLFWKNAIEDLIKEQKHALLTEFAQNDERIEETKQSSLRQEIQEKQKSFEICSKKRDIM